MQFVGGLVIGMGIGVGSMWGRSEPDWKAEERDKSVIKEMVKCAEGMNDEEKTKVRNYYDRVRAVRIALNDDYTSRAEIKELAVDLRKAMEENRKE
jgi:hypothetical protein